MSSSSTQPIVQPPYLNKGTEKKTLWHGRVVYELNSTGAVAWLMKEKAAFIENFGSVLYHTSFGTGSLTLS